MELKIIGYVKSPVTQEMDENWGNIVSEIHLRERIHSMDIQAEIRQHRKKWIEVQQWEEPNLTDCLDFMATEVAEAIDKRLRMSAGYVRNTDKPKPSPKELGVEVFDAIMMGCIALDLLGLDLNEIAREKLAFMDQNKGIV